MDKILIITRNILKRMFIKPTGILLHFVLPISASIGLFLLVSLNTGSQLSIGVVNQDYTDTANEIIQTLSSTSGFNIVNLSSYDLERAVVNQEVVLAINIPKNFEKHLLQNEQVDITVISIGDNNNLVWMKSLISQEVNNFMEVARTADYDPIVYKSLLSKIGHDHVEIESIGLEDLSVEKNGVIQTLGTYMLLLMITTFSISFKILEEKDNGTFTRIGVTSTHSRIYIVANILAGLILATIQISFVLLGLSLFGVEFYASGLQIFVTLITFALCSLSVGVLIASVSKSSNEAYATIGLVLSPSCMIAGCLWPLEYMPSFLQKIAYLMPQRWILDAIQILQREGHLLDILPNILIVLAFTSLFSLLAVYALQQKEISL